MAFPTTFPSFWTQADIDRYREQWNIREAQGLINPDPWWIGNPEWSEGPLNLITGSPTAIIETTSPETVKPISSVPPYSPFVLPGPTTGESPMSLDQPADYTYQPKYASMADLTRLGLVSGKETDANLAITKYGEGFITYDVTKPPDVKPGYYNSIFDPNVYAPELKQTTTTKSRTPASGTGDLIGLGVLAIVGLGLAGAGRSRTRTPRTRTRTRARPRRKSGR